MRQKLFNLAAAVSLVLCVAAGVLWVRSYCASDILKLSGNRTTSLAWGRGQLRLFSTDLSSRPDLQTSEPYRRMDPLDLCSLPPGPGWGKVGIRSQFKAGGFSWYRSAGGIYMDAKSGVGAVMLYPAWQLIIPLWVPAALFGLLPVTRAFRARRRAFDQTHCPVCGYDLRATPERCPECGAVPSDGETAAA